MSRKLIHKLKIIKKVNKYREIKKRQINADIGSAPFLKIEGQTS
jgi:hypothetical protein